MVDVQPVLKCDAFLRVLLTAMLLVWLPAGASAKDGPRPFSAGERAAAEIAANYLAVGPEAIAGRLAAASPLRSLSADEALKEIEVRAGPIAGAQWEMKTVVPSLSERAAVFEIEYPSGVDETLTIELVKEGNEWKVMSLRTLAEKSPNEPVVFASLASQEAVRADVRLLPYAGAIFAALLAGIAAALFRLKPGAARLAALVATAFGIAAVVVITQTQLAAVAAVQKEALEADTPGTLRLSALLPLRRAMAAGDAVLPLVARAGEDEQSVAKLWRAQVDLHGMRLDSVERTLASYPVPSDIPLVELLRGRAAFARYDDVAACRAYERAINLGPGRDALWHEAAEVLSTLGFEDRARTYLERLPKIGSRSEIAYYALAVQSVIANDEADASVQLLRGWKLRPLARERLVASPALWSVLRASENLGGMVSMASVSEPAFRSEATALAPIALPPGATARISGLYLGIEIGDRSLGIPGGAAVAGPNTPLVDAVAWSRREEEAAIADTLRLSELVRTPVALAQPAISKRLSRATEALASRARWDDVISLTEGLSASAENVPLDVIVLKGLALSRAKRTADAKRFLGEVVTSPAMARRTDPVAWYQLGELMASIELYGPAISMLEKADARLEYVSLDDRIRQLMMRQRLETAYRVHATKNFEIRFPDDVSPEGAARLGEVLEAELERLRKIIPLEKFESVRVNVLWWSDFRSTFTGTDHILGLYDGSIMLPFAGINRLDPGIVAIASHELAHAVLAQATNDRAPSWLQEGLAQRIEMVPFHRNAFNMYDDDRLIAIALLDSVLGGSVDPDMIGEAYIESQTLVRYLEAAHGRTGLQKLVAAFRAGANEEEAIGQLSGKSVAELDIAFRNWGRSTKTVFENPRPVDYTSSRDESIRFSRK